MRRNSKELAHRIDILVAFQNGEEIEYRGKKSSDSWLGKFGTGMNQDLVFDFGSMEYRKAPTMIEGYVHPKSIHESATGCMAGPCIYVRQVEGHE